jgi:hypothetical protein
MTREELIEVIRNELWRQVFARNENAETMEYQKQVWDYDWERTLPKAKAMLSALEAAGVRLVPSEPSREMLLKAGATPDGVSPRGGTDYLGKMLPKYYAAMLAASPYAPPGG